jgi:hypothetical protein
MKNINSNYEKGIITISDKYDVLPTDVGDITPYLYSIGDEYILSFGKLNNVKEFKRFTYDSLGLKQDRFLLQYYRISRDGNTWSEWLDLNINITNFPIRVPGRPTLLDAAVPPLYVVGYPLPISSHVSPSS